LTIWTYVTCYQVSPAGTHPDDHAQAKSVMQQGQPLPFQLRSVRPAGKHTDRLDTAPDMQSDRDTASRAV